MKKSCFQCGAPGEDMFGYLICESCKSKFGLFTDETIKKHILLYDTSKRHSYKEELQHRLEFIENDYIKKKIKLLYILDKLNQL